MNPFERTASGTIAAGFSPAEADIVADLAAQITGLLAGLTAAGHDPLFSATGIGGSARAPEDPAVARLLPDAYGQDAGASSEFRQLTERGLATRKVANARTVIDTLQRDGGRLQLTEAEAQAWLRTLADIRLTIAARLGIEADDDEGPRDGEASNALYDLYSWLAYVTETLLDAIEA